MIIIEHIEKTKASPEKIWNLWQDVTHWPKWDHSIEKSSIDGSFVSGATGTLKPKGAPAVKITLSKIVFQSEFISESKLPFAKIIVSHFLEKSADFTTVTHKIEMKGPLAFFFAFVIGRKMKKNLPQDMKNLVKEAENGL